MSHSVTLTPKNLDHVDTLLASMLNQVNMVGTPFSITLSLKGNMLTGTVISEREYMEAFAQASIVALTRGLELRKAPFLSEETQGNNNPDDYSEEAHEGKTLYLHVKDLKSVQPPVALSYEYFSYWRIRASDVEAWTFGHTDENHNIR